MNETASYNIQAVRVLLALEGSRWCHDIERVTLQGLTIIRVRIGRRIKRKFEPTAAKLLIMLLMVTMFVTFLVSLMI